MVKANELRLGNWIFDQLSNERDIQLSASMLYHLAEETEVFKSYQPIPLTEEWLTKFGFQDRHGYWDDVYLEVARHKEGWYHSVNCNEYIDGEPFQYVHELQNLYFALCRKELTIKEA